MTPTLLAAHAALSQLSALTGTAFCPSYMGQPVLPFPGVGPDEDRRRWLAGLRQLGDQTRPPVPPDSPWGYAGYAGQPSDSADVSPEKARTILRDGHVNGHPLTDAQRGMFGAIAGRTDNAKDAGGHGSEKRGGSGSALPGGWGDAPWAPSPQGPAVSQPAPPPPPAAPPPVQRGTGLVTGWGPAGFPGTPQGHPADQSGGGVPERGWGGLGEVWNTFKDAMADWSSFAAAPPPRPADDGARNRYAADPRARPPVVYHPPAEILRRGRVG